MSDAHPIDQTLDNLERAVAGLTSSTSIDALRYIHKLGQTGGCSRHAAESAQYIVELCTQAESSLTQSIEYMEAEHDDAAESHLGHALVHLNRIATTVATLVSPPEAASDTAPRARRSRA